MTTVLGRDPRSGRVIRVDIERGFIASVETSSDTAGPDLPWISAGLVDLQVNGYEGHDVNGPEPRVDEVESLVLALRSVGVTSFVPTIVTASQDQILARLEVLAEARIRDSAVAAAIPTVHLEGPYISDQDGPRGIHDPAHIRAPDLSEVRQWQRVSAGLVGILTVSPHWPAATEFVRAVVGLGVQVAIGHTHASNAQIHAAADAGATLATHLGNATHAQLPRHPNYVWAQLADVRLRVGLIADGHHLDADTFVAMLRAAGTDRAHLVSDSVAIGGLPPGRYEMFGADVELSRDGRISRLGTPFLAGAALSLNHCVARSVRLAGLQLRDAIRLATANPGHVLRGTRPHLGRLRVGAPADVITFDFEAGDDELRIREVFTGVPAR